MTPNRSMELSIRLRDLMGQDILQFIEPIFPFKAIRSYAPKSTIHHRDRVFNRESTFLTMVITALKEDKSLQNSVRIFQEIFYKNREGTLQAALTTQREQQALGLDPKKKTGSTGKVRIPISKMKDISSNTAAFSKARERIELGLIDTAFRASTDNSDVDSVHKWHGRPVFNTDGTYFQMQDAPGIPEKYRVQKNADGTTQGYPQGLLQVLSQHGTGFIYNYRILGRGQSELNALVELLENHPQGSLILADDLYNCYALYCFLKGLGIDILVPDKKGRTYKVVKVIAPGDEIVEICKPSVIKPLKENQPLPPQLLIRRISYKDSEHPEETRVLLTTILDETIERQEFIHKFNTRWDIEITIREIKTMMGVNIVRSKTEDMVFKEMGVALLAYNLIRKIIIKSASETPFSPETDIFEKLYTISTPSLVDRKGRVYSRWSPGRPVVNNRKIKGQYNPA